MAVNIFSEGYVKANAKEVILKNINFETEFVAGLPDTTGNGSTDGRSPCLGDSGGPLVCRNGDNLVLYGVTSWNIGCPQDGASVVYSQVLTAMPWIQKTIGITTTTTPVRPCPKIPNLSKCSRTSMMFLESLENLNFSRFPVFY